MTRTVQEIDSEFGELFWKQEMDYVNNINDARKIYGILNRCMFGGKLPDNMPIKIKDYTNEGFKAAYLYDRNSTDDDITKRSSILIVNEKENSLMQTVDALAHEMIHLYDIMYGPLSKIRDKVLVNNGLKQTIDGYDVHGSYFISWVNKFNDENIPVSFQCIRKNRYFMEKDTLRDSIDMSDNDKTSKEKWFRDSAKQFFDTIKSDEFFAVEVDGDHTYIVIA